MRMRSVTLPFIEVLLILGICAQYSASRSQTNAPAQAEISLGKPQWFTNVRGERWVRAQVTVINPTEHSLWGIGYRTRMLFHDYEKHASRTDSWQRVPLMWCGSGAIAHEIPPHSKYEFDKVFTFPEAEVYVRLRFYLFRRLQSPGNGNFPPVVKEPFQIVSNSIFIPKGGDSPQSLRTKKKR